MRIKTLKKVLNYFIFEAAVIFIFILSLNNYLGNVDEPIRSDGVGYYEYLPSLFIHKDLIRKDFTESQKPENYERLRGKGFGSDVGLYVDYKGYAVNKCFVGTAVLQFPFFSAALLTTHLEGNSNDGYQLPFQKSIFYAAIFYVFCSLLFLRRLLELYEISRPIIVFCQLMLVVATSVIHYANFEASFSHVYSLFAITAFFYFTKSYFQSKLSTKFLWACLFLGLIVLIRPVNLLVLLFIPFLAGSKQNLRDGFILLFTKQKKQLILGIVLIAGIGSIQLLIWYLQTGSFIVYTYQGEGFNFANPAFYSILFSYQKGLFVYTPFLFLTLFGLGVFIYRKDYYSLLSWLSFFLILTYVLSSWWCWYYGASFGLRAYIDFYSIFIILIALLLEKLKTGWRVGVLLISLAAVTVNYIQAYQYRKYILDWVLMDKEKYWEIFLKTDRIYEGLYFKRVYEPWNYVVVHEITIGDITVPKDSDGIEYSMSSKNVPYFNQVDLIQVIIDNEFKEDNHCEISLGIKDSLEDETHYWFRIPLIHYREKAFDEMQTGLFNYEIEPIDGDSDKTITLEVLTLDKGVNLKNVKFRFLNRH